MARSAVELFADDVDEAEEEERGEEVEHPVLAAGAAGEELEEGVAGEAEAEAVGDGPGERDGDDGEEGGDGELRGRSTRFGRGR